MKKIIYQLRMFLEAFVDKSALLVRKYFPWFFSLLSNIKWLRKIYYKYRHVRFLPQRHAAKTFPLKRFFGKFLRNKTYAAKKNIANPMFSNKNNEISVAIKQAMTAWPTRKRLHE